MIHNKTIWQIKQQQEFQTKLINKIKSLAFNCPKGLLEAMLYCLNKPGKYFRPQLIYASGAIYQCNQLKLTSMAIAIELLHTYSLIHDDLPCMDDDDMRRKQPSCHKAFSEATAVLAGDCLQGLAFQCIATDDNLSPTEKALIINKLCLAIGPIGMAGGQFLDLYDNHHKNLFQMKTGALFEACLLLPSYCAANQAHITEQLKKCSLYLGLAYQQQDDNFDTQDKQEDKAKNHYKQALLAIENLPNNEGLLSCLEAMKIRTN